MMQKIIFSFIAVVSLFYATASGQEAATGIKGGLNLSNMSVDGSNDDNLKTGFMLGIFSKVPVQNSFSVQPELLYSPKGIKIEYAMSNDNSAESTLSLQYLEVPVKLVYNLSEDFEFQLGPYLAYLLNAKFESDGNFSDSNVEYETNLDTDHFKRLEFGLTGGMAFDLSPIILGFNYNLGLSNVAKEDNNADFLLGDAKNNVIQIYAALKF